MNVVALDGDKLKPRVDQRKGGNGFGINEDGADYTLTAVDRHGVAYAADGGEVAATITRQISEQSGQDNRANSVVQCYENHAQDSRVKSIEVSDTRNQECIVSTNANGLITKGSGEAILSDEHHMALQCGGGQCGQGVPACVVSTNSNGEDVAPTLTLELARQTGAQQANGGGGVRHQQEGLTSRPSAHTAAEKSQAR